MVLKAGEPIIIGLVLAYLLLPIKEFVEKIAKEKHKIICENEDFTLNYTVAESEAEKIKEYLIQELQNRRSEEIARRQSCVGPHRDDFEIFINDKDANSYGSQGQKKTLALSVKLSLYRVLEEYGKNGIIILDDVFGELDKERQIYLMNVLDKVQLKRRYRLL